MKRARVQITAQQIVDAMKGGTWDAIAALPADARVVDVAYIHSASRIVLVVESAMFADGLEPTLTPTLRPVVESTDQPF